MVFNSRGISLFFSDNVESPLDAEKRTETRHEDLQRPITLNQTVATFVSPLASMARAANTRLRRTTGPGTSHIVAGRATREFTHSSVSQELLAVEKPVRPPYVARRAGPPPIYVKDDDLPPKVDFSTDKLPPFPLTSLPSAKKASEGISLSPGASCFTKAITAASDGATIRVPAGVYLVSTRRLRNGGLELVRGERYCWHDNHRTASRVLKDNAGRLPWKQYIARGHRLKG